jgi:hypothetical protein
MYSRSTCGRTSTATLVALVMTAIVVRAQEITYLGTVVAVEATRVQVRTPDEKTKKEEAIWFVIDKDTRVKRGGEIVSLAAAKIAPGERVAVIVDPATKSTAAKEIRLGAPGTNSAATPGQPAAPGAGGHTDHPPAGQAPVSTDQMAMPTGGWHLMQDGVVYGLYNHQGGPRGGDEFVVPNWWMGVWMRERGDQQFNLNAMLSFDAATVGKSGYGELFQVGEALDGKPLIDRQHPHDFLMQLGGSWRKPLSDTTSLVVAGALAGEPTLGPVAFMHRPSAAGLILAPLGHHTFDSTHISFGVVTGSVELSRWTVEGSVFNGREPDEDRWNLDLNTLDSFAGRIWFRPTDEWAVQVSSGRLHEPEELVPGNIVRTTVSASWFRQREQRFDALTFGYGVNSAFGHGTNAAHGEQRHGVFAEFTTERGRNSFSARVERQDVEAVELLTGEIPEEGHGIAGPVTVSAGTFGANRRLFAWRGFEGALGAQVVFYDAPEVLKASYGDYPVSFQAFFRLRLPTGSMGRMWNMVMSQGHKMPTIDHSGHDAVTLHARNEQ